MEFTFHTTVLNALWAPIRRLLPAAFSHRKLKMPALMTERLVLRAFEQSDLGAIAKWEDIAGSQDVEAAAKEFLDFCFREYRERGAGPWAMQLRETAEIAGNCGFPDINFRERWGEVNYYVAAQYRRRGLATEALNALLALGFAEFGLARIQARCEPDNLGSERVMQKAGMKFDGYVGPAPSSASPDTRQKLYAILRKDFNIKTDRSVKVSMKLGVLPGPPTKT